MSKKEVFLFGAIAVLSLFVMLNFESITGGVGIQCPAGFYYSNGYCIENECKKVKCMKENSFIKRPDCVCINFYDKMLCGIKGNEETGIKSSICTRRGQLDKVCGSYDSDKGHCVENPLLV